mmetsp:Transcript_14863/g.28033  ORF Transcript_14863/g.28033 Transcript_14863/m.28033 type:complete len:111 (-) Transcript_14863:2026-2358(-)
MFRSANGTGGCRFRHQHYSFAFATIHLLSMLVLASGKEEEGKQKDHNPFEFRQCGISLTAGKEDEWWVMNMIERTDEHRTNGRISLFTNESDRISEATLAIWRASDRTNE